MWIPLSLVATGIAVVSSAYIPVEYGSHEIANNKFQVSEHVMVYTNSADLIEPVVNENRDVLKQFFNCFHQIYVSFEVPGYKGLSASDIDMICLNNLFSTRNIDSEAFYESFKRLNLFIKYDTVDQFLIMPGEIRNGMMSWFSLDSSNYNEFFNIDLLSIKIFGLYIHYSSNFDHVLSHLEFAFHSNVFKDLKVLNIHNRESEQISLATELYDIFNNVALVSIGIENFRLDICKLEDLLSYQSQLKGLKLKKVDLGTKGIARIGRFLKDIVELDLSDNRIDFEVFDELIIHMRSVKSLNLSGNILDEYCLETLYPLLVTCGIEKLNISNNIFKFTSREWSLIGKIISIKSLKSLSIDGNVIRRAKDMMNMIVRLKFSNVEYLSMSNVLEWAAFDDSFELDALLKMLVREGKMKYLNLSNNLVGASGGVAIGEGMNENKNGLKVLELAGCGLTFDDDDDEVDNKYKGIDSILSNMNGLYYLNLDDNMLDDKGIEMVIEGMGELKRVSMKRNKLKDINLRLKIKEDARITIDDERDLKEHKIYNIANEYSSSFKSRL